MDLFNPALTVAIALAAGIAAQSLSHHLRLPSIVPLLAVGVLLGPDVVGVVRPSSLGEGLQTVVGFGVAIVLFEGGLNLDIARLRQEQRAIRQLVTIGALITVAGGAVAARFLLGWDWSISVLFGTLVIVTGPTVIQPLLRRIRVKRTVTTILEAEGVLIDAIGAIIAVVALEVLLSPTTDIVTGTLYVAGRLGFGIGAGVVGGFVMVGVLRLRGVVPAGLENVFILGFALFVFQVPNAVLHESGIAAVTVAGVVVGNSRIHVHRELKEFKEQLTVLVVGMLFVLLAADVRMSDVVDLGWAGVGVVAAMILLVRPANVAVGTLGAELSVRERAFLAWIGPRGIVAAAVASIFAVELSRAGIEGGTSLRAMVFLVIAATVLLSGLSGALVARLLGLRRGVDAGWVILGANELARATARLLEEGSESVLCIDTNPELIRAAEEAGTRVLLGNGLEDRTLRRAELDIRTGVVAMTRNEETNMLFMEKARHQSRHQRHIVTLTSSSWGVTEGMLEEKGYELCFGGAVDVELWCKRLRSESATITWWRLGQDVAVADLCTDGEAHPPYVPIAHRAQALVVPVSNFSELAEGDEVAVLMDVARAGDVRERLEGLGLAQTVPA